MRWPGWSVTSQLEVDHLGTADNMVQYRGSPGLRSHGGWG